MHDLLNLETPMNLQQCKLYTLIFLYDYMFNEVQKCMNEDEDKVWEK